jgi:hypothetical protein
MRKYHNHVTVWGRTGSAPVTYSSGVVGHVVVDCKHFPVSLSSSRSIASGMGTLTFFPPNTKSILSRFEPDGLRADWEKVGCGLRNAMSRFAVEHGLEGTEECPQDVA